MMYIKILCLIFLLSLCSETNQTGKTQKKESDIPLKTNGVAAKEKMKVKPEYIRIFEELYKKQMLTFGKNKSDLWKIINVTDTVIEVKRDPKIYLFNVRHIEDIYKDSTSVVDPFDFSCHFLVSSQKTQIITFHPKKITQTLKEIFGEIKDTNDVNSVIVLFNNIFIDLLNEKSNYKLFPDSYIINIEKTCLTEPYQVRIVFGHTKNYSHYNYNYKYNCYLTIYKNCKFKMKKSKKYK